MSEFIAISIDDGHPLDYRVAGILRRYDLIGTFYWSHSNPKHVVMRRQDMEVFIRMFPEMDYQPHGYCHYILTTLPHEEAAKEICRASQWHGVLLGREPKVYCYPRGGYLSWHAALLEELGYVGARAVVPQSKCKPQFELDAGFHLYQKRTPYEIPKALWFHSWEIEKYNMWGELDSLCKRVSESSVRCLKAEEYASLHSQR